MEPTVVDLRALSCRAGLAAVAVAVSSCSPSFWDGASSGLASSQSSALLLFGGQGHDTFLGCLSCSSYDSDSVFNQYGQHGSRYSAESIHNPYSEFGSRYSPYSACNPYASDPPVIVARNGTFVGRLTVNRYNAQRVRDDDILAWLASVCEG